MIRKFTSKTQQVGKIGENLAVMFLVKQGFTIIERNVHSRNGEIDIVAKKQKSFYFFEVKAGKQGSWFNPAENLSQDKMKKLYKAVQFYALANNVTQYKVQGLLVLLPQYPQSQTLIADDTVYIDTTFEIIDLT